MTSEPGEPGSPYAIGGPAGGHKAVEPTLGTLKDFEWLVKKVKAKGMEIALDFAINCSPDHPYVRDHPDWFYQRPDGSIKYAENPPKRYEDIYPLNFHNADWKALWEEMKSIILFWCGKGVRIFRVDNPHTKPVAFWGWLIEGVQAQYPDAIFLSEAFTKPKMMQALAKAGFTQSYSYFNVAQHENGADRILYGADADRDEGLLPRQPVPEHAGHPPVLPPARRTACLPDPRDAGGDAFECLWYLQRLRTVRERRPARPGGILRQREIPIQGARLERARQHQGPPHKTEHDPASRIVPCTSTPTCAFLPSDNDQILFYMKATAGRGTTSSCSR